MLETLYNEALDRKENPKEGSYTNYLFDKGLDKILKKVGEEATEVVIAAKNADKAEIANETADVLYHLAVMLVEDYRISIPEALDILYNSETYEKLQDPRTGLYFQSPVYVYDFLLQELKNGKLA